MGAVATHSAKTAGSMPAVAARSSSPTGDARAVAQTAVGTAALGPQPNRSTSVAYTSISTPTPMSDATAPPTIPAARPVSAASGPPVEPGGPAVSVAVPVTSHEPNVIQSVANSSFTHSAGTRPASRNVPSARPATAPAHDQASNRRLTGIPRITMNSRAEVMPTDWMARPKSRAIAGERPKPSTSAGKAIVPPPIGVEPATSDPPIMTSAIGQCARASSALPGRATSTSQTTRHRAMYACHPRARARVLAMRKRAVRASSSGRASGHSVTAPKAAHNPAPAGRDDWVSGSPLLD